MHGSSERLLDASRPEVAVALPISRLATRVRLALFALAILVVALLLREAPSVGTGAGVEASLAAHVERAHGLAIEPGQLVWLAGPKGPFGLRPVLFVARAPGELPDVYYGDVRATKAGSVLDVMFLENITRSSSAAEGSLQPVKDGAVFTVRVGERFDALVLLDARGEPAELTAEWPAYARVQNAVTNLQETGRVRAFGRYRYSLIPPAETLEVRVQDGMLRAVADGEELAIDASSGDIENGEARLRVQPPVKGRPGTLTWLVDTFRRVSWIGPEPIEWLEHTVFGITDRATRAYRGVVTTDTEAEVREALPMVELSEERVALLTATDPVLGWPPAPLEPVLDVPVKGEGRWLPVVDDPFVNAYPNAPPAFYQTFIRVDPERPYTRVYITLWDPRQVQLHVVMGTREPESATGETGDGSIVRDPQVLGRLVGAFNGGFQAMHGEFGMMSEGRVYLPPKPWAATLAVYDDGRVGMGSWPGPDRGGWDEESANQQIPEDMLAMRQNLTSVVEDGVYNPWKRWWWGAAPEFAQEQTYIHRSGACVTQEHFMAYLWGESMGPEELGKAMIALRCARGMHLDMNSKHTGLEFYRPVTEGTPPLERELLESEFEGDMPQVPGMRVRARKAVTTMTPLRFPRYLSPDPRDFFYLTLKPVLPGPDIAIGTQSIPFETDALPHAGWPPAFARALIAGGNGEGTWLVRIDPTRAVPAALAAPQLERVLGYVQPLPEAAAEGDELALFAAPGPDMIWRFAMGSPPEGARVAMRGPDLATRPGAGAALGVDAEGFLLYAEANGDEREALLSRMQRAGVARAIAVRRLAFVHEERLVSVDGAHELDFEPGDALPLIAETRAPASVLYPDVKPMPYRHWGWLQGQRVRYFPQGEPRFKAPEDAVGPQEGGPKDGAETGSRAGKVR